MLEWSDDCFQKPSSSSRSICLAYDYRQYVPCLRWKTGEYQALNQLTETTKDSITPIIEAAEIGFDFESRVEDKTIDEHLEKLPRRLSQKWSNRPCFLDLSLCCENDMVDGRHPVVFVFDELRDYECDATPITALNRDRKYQNAVGKIIRRDDLGVCIRVNLEEAVSASIGAEIDSFLQSLGRDPADSHLILDLGAPNYIPITGFSKLVLGVLRRFPHLDDWKSCAIVGSSFPESMAEVRRGVNIVPRNEWTVYKDLFANLVQMGLRLPAFGDYAINHPSVTQMDMRILKPSASIRYAVESSWIVVKGRNVRDHKFGQYRDLCRLLMSSDEYDGVSICEGDEFIVACANGGNTSNLTAWRRVGTSRHLAKVVNDISKFLDTSAAQ